MENNEKLTTKDAFSALISQRAWYKSADIPESQASTLANRFKNGKVSLDKIEEILEKCGYKVLQEKMWGKRK
jgi:hypothetical protein